MHEESALRVAAGGQGTDKGRTAKAGVRVQTKAVQLKQGSGYKGRTAKSRGQGTDKGPTAKAGVRVWTKALQLK